MNPIRSIRLDYDRVFQNGFDVGRVDHRAVQSDFDRGVKEAAIIGCTGVLYGASTSGELALRLLDAHPDITVRQVVDLAPAKSEFCGLKVVRPNAARWGEFVLVAVSPSNYLSVMQTVHELVPENVLLCFLWKNESFDPSLFGLLKHTITKTEPRPVPVSGDTDTLKQILQQSRADSRGAIFFSGAHTFRLILKQDLWFYQPLIKDAAQMEILYDAGLVETRQAEFAFPDYPLVLEHRSLIPQGPTNWSNTMLRDAALFFLEFWRRLIRRGFSLQDCHSGNVMFENTKPRFVDFTSIGPREATTYSRPFVEAFFASWIHPVALLKSNQPILLRALLRTGTTSIPLSTIQEACPANICQEVRDLEQRVMSCFQRKHLDAFFDITMSWVASVNPAHGGLGWNRGGYQDNVKMAESPKTVKERAVDVLCEKFRPELVLDLGCNVGRFSVLAARHGARVVAVDFADELLDELYWFAREEALPILPMVASVHEMKSFRQPEVHFDMTLVLALIHHLVFSYHMDVDSVLNVLDGVTKRVLVLEFAAADPREVKLIRDNYSPEAYPKYNMSYVISWLEQHFGPVETVPVGETRTLLVAMR